MATPISYGAGLTVQVEIRFPGSRRSLVETAIVDTGFYHGTTDIGLKIPARRIPRGRNRPRGTVTFTLAHNRRKAFKFEAGAKLIRLGQLVFPRSMTVGTIFGAGPALVGLNLLKCGTLTVDGPAGRAQFKVP